MKNTYQNFIFDLYGTLVDIRTNEELPELWQAAADYLNQKGMEYTPVNLRRRYYELCDIYQKRMVQDAESRSIEGPVEIDLRMIWDSLAKEKGCSLTPEENEEFSRLFRTRSTLRLRLYPHAAELLTQLRRAGKKVCLLTNAQECFTMSELNTLGIRDAFDLILISSHTGTRKPSPDIFGRLWKSGLQPEDSLMIGNDPVCDCQGAASAGMDSLFFRTEQSPSGEYKLPENCREIYSLKEVTSWI